MKLSRGTQVVKVNLLQPKRYETAGATASFIPFALYYLYLALKKYTNCEMTIIDFELADYSSKSYKDVVVEHPADLFMVTATTLSRFEAIQLVRQIKKTSQNSLVLTGGPHFSNCVEDTLKRVPEIDVVVRGEGEVTAVQFVNAVENGQTWETVPGISFRKGNVVIHNESQKTYQDLDELDSLADVRDPRYRTNVVSYPDEDVEAASIMTTRGCPHRCVFCSMVQRKLRFRNPSRVVDELEYIGDRYGIRGFNFLDATFTGSIKYTRRICEEIIARKLDIKWWCESRVDIPLQMIALMKEAGCVSIQIGVESGSDRVLNLIKKKIVRDQVIAFCERCNALKVYVKPLYMVSLPEETIWDAFQTFTLSKSLVRLAYVIPAPMRVTEVYPGTALETMARKSGLLPADFHWYQHFNNKRDINRWLNVSNDPFEHVPVFMDAMGPKKLSTVIRVEKTWDSTIRRGERLLNEPAYRRDVCRDATKMTVELFKAVLRRLMCPRGVKWAKWTLHALGLRRSI